jgi:hypothetical protein
MARAFPKKDFERWNALRLKITVLFSKFSRFETKFSSNFRQWQGKRNVKTIDRKLLKSDPRERWFIPLPSLTGDASLWSTMTPFSRHRPCLFWRSMTTCPDLSSHLSAPIKKILSVLDSSILFKPCSILSFHITLPNCPIIPETKVMKHFFFFSSVAKQARVLYSMKLTQPCLMSKYDQNLPARTPFRGSPLQ